MSTSYQTVLVVADPSDVGTALAAAGTDGLVMPAGTGRTAVLPKEDRWQVADVDSLAAQLSATHGWPTLSNALHDSDVLILRAYRRGDLFHEYLSDQSMLVDWFIDDDGATRFRIADVEYPAGTPAPTGPSGDDPGAFAPFGVGPVDLDQLGARLRGDPEGDEPDAELRHWKILEALHLDPRGLTTAFRHANRPGIELPGAVRITAGN